MRTFQEHKVTENLLERYIVDYEHFWTRISQGYYSHHRKHTCALDSYIQSDQQ